MKILEVTGKTLDEGKLSDSGHFIALVQYDDKKPPITIAGGGEKFNNGSSHASYTINGDDAWSYETNGYEWYSSAWALDIVNQTIDAIKDLESESNLN